MSLCTNDCSEPVGNNDVRVDFDIVAVVFMPAIFQIL